MKIAVLGAGALGTLFGGRLTKGGNEVILIDPYEELVDAVKRDGIFITDTQGAEENIRVNIVETSREASEQMGYADLILVLVKGMFTETAVKNAKPLVGPNTYFLTLQNGIGNPQIIAEYYPAGHVFYGVTIMGGLSEGLGRVSDRSVPGSACNIMAMSGKITPELERVAQALISSGIGAVLNEEAQQLIWEKLTMNCVANSTGVIARMTNGNFMASPDGLAIARMIVDEVCAVGNAKKIPMDADKIYDWIVEKLSPQTEMYSSMAQDAMRKRPIEIETITGGVIREADALGIPVPVSRTIYHFDRLIAANYDKQW